MADVATDDRELVETVAEAAWKGSVLGSKPPLWAGWDTLDPVAQDVFRVMARSVVAALREADLLWEPSPERCDDERLRPGGYPTRNWDWVKCDEEKGHEGEHENNETGLHWPDDAPQYL